MFKQLLNEFQVKLSFKPQGPILIKSGIAVSARTDMSFVRTFRGGSNGEVYLPGSSLKGVIRSHAEKIGRTLNETAVCNPFNTLYTGGAKNPSPLGVASCSDAFRKCEKDKIPLTSHEVYQASCPACKLFGSLAMGGRFNIGDAYAQGKKPTTEYRDGVGIDRFTGGAVNKAKFDFEVITSGEFSATLNIKNFELWQLSLISYVLRDFEEGLVSIGMGTSRGLGQIVASLDSIRVDVISAKIPDSINGIGALYQGSDHAQYGFAEEPSAAFKDRMEFKRTGIRHSLVIPSDKKESFYELVQDYFPNFIRKFNAMQTWRHNHKMPLSA